MAVQFVEVRVVQKLNEVVLLFFVAEREETTQPTSGTRDQILVGTLS